MPTQSGNNRAGPTSEEFEKVKESLKAIWGNTWPLLRERKCIILEVKREHLDPAGCRLCFGRQAGKTHPFTDGRHGGKTEDFGERNGKAHFVSKTRCVTDSCSQGRQGKGTLHLGAPGKASATRSPAPAPWRGARALPAALQGKTRTLRRVWPWFIAP